MLEWGNAYRVSDCFLNIVLAEYIKVCMDISFSAGLIVPSSCCICLYQSVPAPSTDPASFEFLFLHPLRHIVGSIQSVD
jgi:hypothetical protein